MLLVTSVCHGAGAGAGLGVSEHSRQAGAGGTGPAFRGLSVWRGGPWMQAPSP